MIIKYIRKYWFLAIFAVLSMIGEVAADLYQPRMMEAIVDDGILGLNAGGIPDLSIVTGVGLRMILVVVMGDLCGVLCDVLSTCAVRTSETIYERTAFGESCIFPLHRRINSPSAR